MYHKEIDIRDERPQTVQSIRFGEDDGDVITLSFSKLGKKVIVIAGGDMGSVYMKDINNLIKALEKSKELWYT